MLRIVQSEAEAPGCKVLGLIVEIPDDTSLADAEAALAAYVAAQAALEAPPSPPSEVP